MSEKKETTLVYSFTLTSKSAIFLFGLVLLLAGSCLGFAYQLSPIIKDVEATKVKVKGQGDSLQTILNALKELEPK
jgi:hypothetical protein